MFKTFQSALFISFVGLILLCFIIFTILATPRIKTAAINQISNDLYKQASLISAEPFKKDSSAIQDKVLEAAKLSGSRVTLIAKNGKVLADSSTPFSELGKLENHISRPEIIEAQKYGKGKAVRYSATLGKDFIYVAIPIQGDFGYLRLSVPTTYAANLVLKIHKSMAVALIIVILVAIALSMLFSRSFAHPIIKLGRYRSEFVANVSHELKTPLTAIRGYVETLVGGAIEDKEHNRDFLNKIDKHVSHLSYLIDDILEISRLESKREIEPFANIDIVKVIERAWDTVAERAKEKQISLVKKCDMGPCFIPGLEDHIYRALLNILDNAINYTASGGSVELLCRKTKDKLELVVSDTGIGIPQKHLARIFERFYRVDKARSRQLGGTGLGLSIVKHVMNIHHGAVDVESEVGTGSKFTLIFPLA